MAGCEWLAQQLPCKPHSLLEKWATDPGQARLEAVGSFDPPAPLSGAPEQPAG